MAIEPPGLSWVPVDGQLSLALALGRTRPDQRVLTIRQRCVGDDDDTCNRVDVREWARDWSDVVVELPIDNDRRPDIVLLRDGTPIGAVEVVATHAMSTEKAAALAAMHLPWIEVSANDAMAAREAWSTSTPLDARRADQLEPWRCPTHAEQRVLKRERGRRVRRQPDALGKRGRGGVHRQRGRI